MYRPVSTGVGDHPGILSGAVVPKLFFWASALVLYLRETRKRPRVELLGKRNHLKLCGWDRRL